MSHLQMTALHSTVVRTYALGAGGRGSITWSHHTKDIETGGLRLSAWRLALMS